MKIAMERGKRDEKGKKRNNGKNGTEKGRWEIDTRRRKIAMEHEKKYE